MVDQTLAEQNAIEVEAKPEVKSTRRRNNRNKSRRNAKENSGAVAGTPTEGEAAQNPRGERRVRQRAPRVRTEGDEVREKADYTDGILRLKISNSRPRTVYTRLVRLMLAGYDGAGNVLETSVPIHTIEVSALGNAIGSAIFVADNLIKANVVEQTSIAADFVAVDGDQVAPVEENKFKGSPRLLITLKRVASWEAKDDEVLQKTRVYRTKVLGLEEEVAPVEGVQSTEE